MIMQVLLTGANGFLGARLAKDLLNEGHGVFLLVRNAKKLDRFLKEMDNERLTSKINILEGDITSEHFGLEKEVLRGLNGQIDAIIHMAALLSFDESDREYIHHVNVGGTRNTLNFSKEINCKKFLYVSTAYTVGTETEGTEELYSLNREFVNQYEKTKCEAEHLVQSYSDSFSVSILRPSIIIGDSVTGEAETNFGMYGVIKSLLVLKRRMKRNSKLQDQTYRIVMDKDVASNIVPVDYVSTVLQAALLYSKNKDIFNIVNPNPPKQGTIFNLIKDYLDLTNIEMVNVEDADQLRDDEKLFNKPLAVFSNYTSRNIHFSCDSTKRLLENSNQSLLKMDDQMIHNIVTGYLNERL